MAADGTAWVTTNLGRLSPATVSSAVAIMTLAPSKEPQVGSTLSLSNVIRVPNLVILVFEIAAKPVAFIVKEL